MDTFSHSFILILYRNALNAGFPSEWKIGQAPQILEMTWNISNILMHMVALVI